jgi:phospholipase C
MTETLSTGITRRNFLKILVAAGAGVVATGVLNTLRASVPISTPIKNVIFFIQENHSFDSLFAGFPGANGKNAGQRCADALGRDPPHKHADAFEPDGATTEEARCSYQEADAPNYWKTARTFTLCDNYFSDVRGPSHPNFLMMTSGQSPIIDPPPPDVCPEFCLDNEVLANRLDEAGLTWRDYGGILTSTRSLVGRPEIMDFRDEIL